MSKINDLRKSEKYQLNFIDILSEFIPEKKTKYLETFLRIYSNENSKKLNESKEYLKSMFMIDDEKLSKYNDFTIIMFYSFINSVFTSDNFKEFILFCESNEANLLKNKDLSKYNKLEQIFSENDIVIDKIQMKKLEKQVKKLYETDEWLVVRPLTFEASQKYGSNTKWCTTQKEHEGQFEEYVEEGILIYLIPKNIPDGKIGVLYFNDETTYWDSKDKKRDLFYFENIPDEIIVNVIRSEIREQKTNNEVYKEILEENENGVETPISRLIDNINQDRPDRIVVSEKEINVDIFKILKDVFEDMNYDYQDIDDESFNPDDIINVLKEKIPMSILE